MFRDNRIDRVLHLAVVSIAASFFGASTFAQNGLPYVFIGPEGSAYFGHGIASGGDADRDGYEDVFVTDKYFKVDGVTHGRAVMVSGRSRAVMWDFVCPEPASGTPFYLTPDFIGDVNRDGRDDVILGQPAVASNTGRVDVLSGATGQVLYSYSGALGDRLGRAVAGVGDVDGDDVPDFAFVTAWREEGLVSVRSGVDGSEIHLLHRPWPRSIAGAGDLNGDHRADIIIGSYNDGRRGVGAAAVSGIDGSLIYDLPPNGNDDVFGWAVAGGRDLTGDPTPDFAFSGFFGFNSGRVYVYDGATGLLATTLTHTHTGQLFGFSLAIADVDGDGAYEVCVGTATNGIHVFDPASGQPLGLGPLATGDSNAYYGDEYAMGDVNGDGRSDVLAGRQGDGGSVHASAGAPILLSPTPTGTSFSPSRTRGPVSLMIHHVDPFRRVYVLANQSGVACSFHQQLNICIDLRRPLLVLGSTVTDAEGFAEFVLNVTPQTPTGPVWLQALDRNSPTHGPITSNVLEIEIVE